MDKWLKRVLAKQEKEWQRQREVIECAEYLIGYDWSLRRIAAEMCIPYIRVYRNLRYDLKHINYEMYRQCRTIMKKHRWNRAGKLW